MTEDSRDIRTVAGHDLLYNWGFDQASRPHLTWTDMTAIGYQMHVSPAPGRAGGYLAAVSTPDRGYVRVAVRASVEEAIYEANVYWLACIGGEGAGR